MMLEHLGERSAADAIVRAIEAHVADGGLLTRDLGGQADTATVAGDLQRRARPPDTVRDPDVVEDGTWARNN